MQRSNRGAEVPRATACAHGDWPVMLAALIVLTIAAVAAAPSPARAQCASDSTSAVAGGLMGAALGGFLGSQFGSGGGKTAATIGGVVLGGLAGHQAGKAMTCQDEQYVHDSTYDTLETGGHNAWRNPDSGNYGEVYPTGTYTNSRGYPCRSFEREVYVNGRFVNDMGTACKQPDGSWLVVS